jgi:small-conductance mechanosensitive channel/CRP-like cAMP-binding protein
LEISIPHVWTMLGPAMLALLLVVLRTLTRNPWIKKRLTLSILLLALVFVAGLVVWRLETAPPLVVNLKLLAIILAVVVAAVVLVFNRFTGSGVSDKFPSIVQDAVVIGVFALIAVYLAPDQLLATSAVGGLVIGLALQDTLGNLFAGLALQVEKPFFVGDWISVGRLEGRVHEVTWRATKILTKAGHFCVIPNTVLSKDVLVNFSHPSPVLRLEKTIGFGYEAHPNRVKRVILETLADIPEILRNPKPDVLLTDYADFSINYRCRFWINDFGRSESVMDRFTTLLYYRLEREGLTIPFPIRDVRMAEPPGGAETAGEGEYRKRLAFIKRTDLFATLLDEEMEKVARCLEKLTFAVEETIIRQGQKGDSMFFIEKGRVRIILENDGLSEQLAVLGEGQYFGEMALLTGEARSATGVAVTDVHAYILRKDSFREVLVEHPEIVEKVSRIISDRKAALVSKSAELESLRADRKRDPETLLMRIRGFFGIG